MALKTYTVVLTAFALAACAVGLAPVALGATGGAAVPSGTAAAGSSAASSTSARARTSIATWFGPGLYGKQTACGQTLTPQVVGVANRTLPCGTLVQVTYAGHSLTVPVLDRGPYAHSASWDLTAGAATALDITETVEIVTRVVGKTTNTPTLGLPQGASDSTAPSGGSLAG